MEKRCAKLHKDKYEIDKKLRLQGTHCLYTFIQSEVRKWQSLKSDKN